MNNDVVSAVAQALADRTRLQVLDAVDGHASVGEIAELVGITSATTSFHLRRLEAAGLVVVSRHGTRTLPQRVPDAARVLIRALE